MTTQLANRGRQSGMEIGYRSLLPQRLRIRLRRLIVDCAVAGCRGFHLSHALLARQPGIFLDQAWCCSPACLGEALRQRIKTQLGTAVTDLRQPPRMPFRLILLARGIVSEEQLVHARRVQGAGPGTRDLGDVLAELDFASEEEVAAARAAEAGCLFMAGAASRPVGAEWSLPLVLMRRYHATSVHYSPANGRLLVGFVYRVDSSLLQAIEQVTGCRAEACMITASAWSRQLASGPARSEMHEAAPGRRRLLTILVDHAVASGADRMRLASSSGFVWSRLTARPRSKGTSHDQSQDQVQDLIIDLPAQHSWKQEDLDEPFAPLVPASLVQASSSRLVRTRAIFARSMPAL